MSRSRAAAGPSAARVRCRSSKSAGMRRFSCIHRIAAGAGLAVAGGIYRDGFDGKQTAWVKGGANVPFTEDAHEITTQSAHTFPSSEYLRLRVEPTPGNLSPFVHYRYATPPAPVTDELSVSLRVRSSRP